MLTDRLTVVDLICFPALNPMNPSGFFLYHVKSRRCWCIHPHVLWKHDNCLVLYTNIRIYLILNYFFILYIIDYHLYITYFFHECVVKMPKCEAVVLCDKSCYSAADESLLPREQPSDHTFSSSSSVVFQLVWLFERAGVGAERERWANKVALGGGHEGSVVCVVRTWTVTCWTPGRACECSACGAWVMAGQCWPRTPINVSGGTTSRTLQTETCRCHWTDH